VPARNDTGIQADITDSPDETGRPLPARENRARQAVGRDLTREVIGSFYDVYNDLGFGFREDMYKRKLVISLKGGLLHFGPKAEFKRVLGGWRHGSKRGDQEKSG